MKIHHLIYHIYLSFLQSLQKVHFSEWPKKTHHQRKMRKNQFRCSNPQFDYIKHGGLE